MALLHPSVARQTPPLVLSVSRGGRRGGGAGGGEKWCWRDHTRLSVAGRLSIILYYRSFVTVSFEAANFLPARLGTTTFLLHNRLLASGAALLTPATTAEDTLLNQNAGTLCIHVALGLKAQALWFTVPFLGGVRRSRGGAYYAAKGGQRGL